MKTKIGCVKIILLFLAFHSQARAQEYVPLAVDGASWFVVYDVMANPTAFDALWEYHTHGDTVVDGQTYLKVYRRDLELNEGFVPPFVPAAAFELVGLLREDFEERKVYAVQLSVLPPSPFYDCPLGEESLLFDFALTVSDTASFCAMPGPDIMGEIEITAIVPTMLWGLETRAFESFVGSYYEGIGSDFGLFEMMIAPFKSPGNRYVVSTFLVHYCRETPCDYVVSTDELRETAPRIVSPNPATTQAWLQLPENIPLTDIQIELYSPTGSLLYRAQPQDYFHKIDVAHLPKGLYLIRLWDGEKWVVEKLVVS